MVIDGLSSSGYDAAGDGIITWPQCSHCGLLHWPWCEFAGTDTFAAKEADTEDADPTNELLIGADASPDVSALVFFDIVEHDTEFEEMDDFDNSDDFDINDDFDETEEDSPAAIGC